jgi:hypothetical protein
VPDRIADPWGLRTPYGRPNLVDRLLTRAPAGVRARLPGTLTGRSPWPVRTDMYLEPGVREADVDRWVQSASILHSNGDALDIAVKDGRIVGVRGRAVDRINRGWLDPKDLFGWQANASPDRLTTPLVRERGRLVAVRWSGGWEHQSVVPRAGPRRATYPHLRDHSGGAAHLGRYCVAPGSPLWNLGALLAESSGAIRPGVNQGRPRR